MRGFVETPDHLVDLMIGRLFNERRPTASDRLLDPGCGTGAFIAGVLQWCQREGAPVPHIDGVDLDPARLGDIREAITAHKQVRLIERDFLGESEYEYDFVIGNPPYVPITQLGEEEKAAFRRRYRTARGRFDLYFLFFEQAIRQLKRGGTMVFITPEKYLYVESARELRKLLASLDITEVELVSEDAFPGRTAYPAVTSLVNRKASCRTRFSSRSGHTTKLCFPTNGDSLLPQMNGNAQRQATGHTLDEVCSRISAGVATGADAVFVRPSARLGGNLRSFAYPTVSGRQLTDAHDNPLRTVDCMLVPYDHTGGLRPFEELGAFGEYLSQQTVRNRLLSRTCVKRKPWYAFHETPPMEDILQPKILCKDISPAPRFWLDGQGTIVPRHTVYYLVPKPGVDIHLLAEYLGTSESCDWLSRNCQRAANGFVRLQSSVLKRLPIPVDLAIQPDVLTPRLVCEPAKNPYKTPCDAVLIGIA